MFVVRLSAVMGASALVCVVVNSISGFTGVTNIVVSVGLGVAIGLAGSTWVRGD